MRSLVVTLPQLMTAVICALAGPLAAPQAFAEETRLTGMRIHEALAGNTVVGEWGSQPYRSYFRPDGLTIYKPEGAPAETGKWRVDEENDQYCSWWARSGWSCYNVYRDGRTIIWEIPGTETRYPSEIMGGKRL